MAECEFTGRNIVIIFNFRPIAFHCLHINVFSIHLPIWPTPHSIHSPVVSENVENGAPKRKQNQQKKMTLFVIHMIALRCCRRSFWLILSHRQHIIKFNALLFGHKHARTHAGRQRQKRITKNMHENERRSRTYHV